MKTHAWKSLGAVLTGFLAVFILSVATDTVLEYFGIFPPIRTGLFITWMLVVAFLYRSAYAILGGYITAKLAPDRPMRHVRILGVIGTVMGCLGIIGGWNLSDHWYPIALAATAYPLVWLGGKLQTKSL